MQTPANPTQAVDTKPQNIMAPEKKKPVHYPFWFGGSASSMAACVTHPLDLGKPRPVPANPSMSPS